MSILKRVETVLGIETSCDETSAAVVRLKESEKPEILSNIIFSQIEIHKQFGGVVPEIASRNHTMTLTPVVSEALNTANVTLDDITAIGVTYGAGLLGALLTGVSYAKGLSFSRNIPLIKVNHIEAHIAANFLKTEPPFVCLVVSGGHTMVALIEDYDNYTILKQSIDDAAGEAFDKVARVLGLPYPGGPEIDRLASLGKEDISFFKHSKGIESEAGFSYSGLKTAVINYIHNLKQKGGEIDASDVCASFTKEALLPLINCTVSIAKQRGIKRIALAGGVSANTYLRKNIVKIAHESGIEAFFPSLGLCTDNAGMVAVRAAFDRFLGKNEAGLDLNAVSVLRGR